MAPFKLSVSPSFPVTEFDIPTSELLEDLEPCLFTFHLLLVLGWCSGNAEYVKGDTDENMEVLTLSMHYRDTDMTAIFPVH